MGKLRACVYLHFNQLTFCYSLFSCLLLLLLYSLVYCVILFFYTKLNDSMPLPDTPRTRKHPTDHEVDSPKTKKLKAFRVVDASIITDLSSTHDTTDNDNGGEIDYNKIKELLKLARQATRYALELYTYYPEEDSRAESKAQTLLSKEAIWQAQKVYKELKRKSNSY
jgi:hypothetical protein